MLNFLSLLLLPLHLLSSALGTTNPVELAKVANVVHHYVHHVDEHGETDLSFADFLIQHFGSRQSDDREHDSLPLMGCHTASVVPIDLVNETIDYAPTAVDLPIPPIAAVVGSTRSTSLEIFQPPRQK